MICLSPNKATNQQNSQQTFFQELLKPGAMEIPTFHAELYKKRQKGFKLDLKAMETAIAELSIDSTPKCSIQVVGTNGKGTTSTCIASILAKKGISVGLFTSPHLLSFRERIQTNSHWPDLAELELHYKTLKRNVKADLSFFEWAALIAKSVFRKLQVDVEVWEAGLGGRLDATTAFKHHVLAVTSVGLDHQHVLGKDHLSICAEKLGAAKPGQEVFIASRLHPDSNTDQQLKNWMETEFSAKGIKLHYDDDQEINSTSPISHTEINTNLAAKICKHIRDSFQFETNKTSHDFHLLGRDMELAPSAQSKRTAPNIQSYHVDVCHNFDSLLANLQALTKENNLNSILLYSCLKDKWSKNIESLLSNSPTPSALFGSGPLERKLEISSTIPSFKTIECALSSKWFHDLVSKGPTNLRVWGSFFGIQDFLKLGLVQIEGSTSNEVKPT